MKDIQQLVQGIISGNQRALARCISIVENDSEKAFPLLESLQPDYKIPVIGITGPPGAGKSTLVNAVISHITHENPSLRIAVVAVDPTSPFTSGSLLGDRLRMTGHFNNANIFIRSLATRGNLGGLSGRTLEVIDVIRSAPFDVIIVETVGVGQSEVEVAGLADLTAVVLVPESGDEIQTIKSGIMEIGDLFVINKSDREGADILMANLRMTLSERPGAHEKEIPVIKTVAQEGKGIIELTALLLKYSDPDQTRQKKILNQKALRVAQDYLMRKIDVQHFIQSLENERENPEFNLYRFIKKQLSN